MLKERTGRVTFMPLNRLKPKSPPTPNAQDAIPLIDKLRFDNAHVKAFQQVFGKTCVCRDLTIAAAYVKSHGINTITLDGDKVDRKGALTGGYHDVRRSRIEAIKSVSSWKAKYTEADTRLSEVKTTIAQLEQEITRIVGRIQVLTNQQNQARHSHETLTDEISALNREHERVSERITRFEADTEELESELRSAGAKVEGFRAELASPLAQGLTPQEERMIEELGREVEQHRKQLLELGQKKNEVRQYFYFCYACEA